MNYAEFFAASAPSRGSTTYEWILDDELADRDLAEWKWPYDIPCWVFTHRQLQVVPGAAIAFTSADVAAVHAEMVAAAVGRNVWIVGGGDLAGQFADAGCWTRSSCTWHLSRWAAALRSSRGASSYTWKRRRETATSSPQGSRSSAGARAARRR